MAENRVPVLGLAVLAMCCLLVMGCGGEQTTAPPTPGTPAGPSGGGLAEIPDDLPFVKMGPEEAVVKLVAFYPEDEGHKFIVDYLKEFAEAHSDSVSLVVINHFKPESFDVWQSSGLNCAGVLVNGKAEWDVETDGKTEKVSFIKRMGVLWTKEDFEQVVNKLLEEAGTAEPAAG